MGEGNTGQFRFSLKLPQSITHDNALRGSRAELDDFFEQAGGLGRKQGALLVQLPPALVFEPRVARQFFRLVRERWSRAVVCEPRHASWFEPRAHTVLEAYKITRAATDPTSLDEARRPGGWIPSGRERGLVYYRLHGSPRKYWSSYSTEWLHALALEMTGYRKTLDVWCIFDNTASGAAAANALTLQSLLRSDGGGKGRSDTVSK